MTVDVEGYRANLRERGYAELTVKTYVNAIANAFRRGVTSPDDVPTVYRASSRQRRAVVKCAVSDYVAWGGA